MVALLSFTDEIMIIHEEYESLNREMKRGLFMAVMLSKSHLRKFRHDNILACPGPLSSLLGNEFRTK